MSQQSNRWIVQVVLALAVVAFIGVSLLPLIGAKNTPISAQNSTPGATTAPSSDEKAKLQDLVRGYELVLQREPENQTVLKGLLQARLQILSQKGKNQIQPADIQAVIEPLEKLVKLNPDKSEYAVLLAQAKQQIGDKEGAAQAYRVVLNTKPGDLKALQGLVSLLISQKRPEAAIGLLQDTLNQATQANITQPGSVDTIAVYVLLGSVHTFEKNYAKALEVYNQGIKKDAKDFRPVLAKAMLLKEQGKDTEAKPLFDSASALAPAQYRDEIKKVAAFTPATPSTPATTSTPSTPATTPSTP